MHQTAKFVLCLRGVGDDLVPHEDLIGLYKVPNTAQIPWFHALEMPLSA